MKDKCKEAVALAAGRTLSDKELDLIEDHLKGAMKRVYLENPKAAAAMAPSDLYAKAVAQARKEIVQQAVEAKIRSAQNIAKAAANLDYVNGQAPAASIKSLFNLLSLRASLDKSGRLSVESRQAAMGSHAWGKMPTLGAILKDETRLTGSFLDELFGKTSGDPLARKAAAEWNAAIDEMHAAAKLAGMPIGKLDNWRLPQRQSSYKVAANRDAWVEDHMGWVDRAIYRNPDGTMFTDEQMRAFLGKAADTIATDGAAKDSGGGGGFSTSRRSYQKERQIHFKDADSWRAAQKKYGDKTVAQLIDNHTVAFSRDIALTEAFGSDYRGAFAELLRQATLRTQEAVRDGAPYSATGQKLAVSAKRAAMKVAGQMDATQRKVFALQDVDADSGLAQRYFDAVAGDSGHTSPEGAAWAWMFDNIRNAVTFATMGGAGINSMPDMAGFSMVARLSTLPEIQLWLKTMRNFLLPRNKADKELVNRIGLGVQTILEDVRRYVRDDPVMNFSAKAANFAVVAGLLHRFEEGKAMAVASVMHDAIGALTRKHEWDALPKGDRLIFESSGVDKATWDLWRAADLERGDDGSRTILLPEHLYGLPDAAIDPAIADRIAEARSFHAARMAGLERNGRGAFSAERRAEWDADLNRHLAALRDEARRDAALKLSGVVGREVKFASGTPGVERRVTMGLDKERSGLSSELQRSMWFLKATPVSILFNYWQRSRSMGEVTNPTLLRARYFVTASVLGMMVMELKNLFNGQDAFNPFDLKQEKYGEKLVKAVLTGGALGVYGDLILQNQDTKNTHSLSGLIGGPIIGLGDDLMTLEQDVAKWSTGGKADIGGDLVRFSKRHLTPNIFYAKALLDHYIFQQLQEMFSPGYNARAQARMEKSTGTKYWWDFGKTEPKRAPGVAR